jgi:hypothetical protein
MIISIPPRRYVRTGYFIISFQKSATRFAEKYLPRLWKVHRGTGVRREGSSVAEQGSLAAGASAPAGAAPAGGVTFPMRGKSPKAHQGTFRKVPWTFRARGPAAKRWARVQPSSRPREKPRGGFPHWILLPSLRGLYEGWGRLRLNNPAFKRQILRITSSSPPPRQGSLSEGA